MDSRDPYDIDIKLVSEFAPETYQDYLKVFKQLDINKDGSVSRDEIIKGN